MEVYIINLIKLENWVSSKGPSSVYIHPTYHQTLFHSPHLSLTMPFSSFILLLPYLASPLRECFLFTSIKMDEFDRVNEGDSVSSCYPFLHMTLYVVVTLCAAWPGIAHSLPSSYPYHRRGGKPRDEASFWYYLLSFTFFFFFFTMKQFA